MTTQVSGTTGVSQIQDNTVTSAKIVDGAITGPDLNGGQSGSAPILGVRAWCMFNGTTAGTNAPTAGNNVTSITRNSAGNYTVNFTTAMSDANFAVMGIVDDTTVAAPYVINGAAARAAGSYTFTVKQSGTGAVTDVSIISIAFLR